MIIRAAIAAQLLTSSEVELMETLVRLVRARARARF